MEVWSGMDGADSRPGGRVWEKVMWKWNAAELDARQRPLQSRRERLLKNSKTKWKPRATWERLPRPCFAVVPITQNNLVCDIISPPGRVVLLFIYLSILTQKLDARNERGRGSSRAAATVDKQLQRNYRKAFGDRGGNASLSKQLTAWANSASDMQNREGVCRKRICSRKTEVELRRPGVTVGGKKIKLPRKRLLWINKLIYKFRFDSEKRGKRREYHIIFFQKIKTSFYAIKLEKESKWDMAKTKFAEDKQNKKSCLFSKVQ